MDKKSVVCIYCERLMQYNELYEEWYCDSCDFGINENELESYVDMVENRTSTCDECGKKFNIDDAASEFHYVFDGLDYLAECGGHMCADCLIKEKERDVIE